MLQIYSILLDFQLPFTSTNGQILLVCSWNCLAIANDCTLYLQGFISNSPNAVKSIKIPYPIKSIDICDKFCLVLSQNGKVYKLLTQHEEELNEIKFQHTITTLLPQKRNIFGESKKMTEDRLEIAQIACGNNIVIAISTTNAIFNGTTQIYQLPRHQRIKQVKCGFEHALLLTANGDIYAWGNGL